jgi:hypothetical protein
LDDEGWLKISTDLRNALHFLRSDRSLNNLPILLWVDAICIDQKTDSEKAIQVLRMKETYEGACKVIVWLGDEPERREATGRAAAFLCDHIPLTSEGYVPILPKPNYFRDPENDTIMRTIGQDVMRQAWWWRIWVIQEVAVAKSLAVICNGHYFSWERLHYTVQWITLFQMDVLNASAELVKENPFFPNITFKALYRWKLEHGEAIGVLDLLENASSCLAKDPRDMIFSVLGLASDIEALPTINSEHKLVCNYERSVQEVYTGFAKIHIHTHNSLDVITFSRNYEGRIAGLLSWVPDWSDLRNSSCSSLGKRTLRSAARVAIQGNAYAYKASGGMRPEFEFLQYDTLRVWGIRVDTVTQVGEPYFDVSGPGDQFDRTISRWEAIALGEGNRRALESYVGTEQTLSEAFDRTITADMNLQGDRVQNHERFGVLNRGLGRLMIEAITDFGVIDTQRWQVQMKDASEAENSARRAVFLRILRRLFFTTLGERFGLGPWDTKTGDVVFVLLGCDVPVILRQNGDRWIFVGEAFVMGIMDGEMVEAAELYGPGDNENVEQGEGRRVENVLIR